MTWYYMIWYECKDGETALMRAADSDHRDIVRYLIEAGAEINVADKVSKWLSMYTCRLVCVCVCLILLPWNCIIIEYSHYHQFLHFYYYLFLLRMIALLNVSFISYVNISTNIFLSFSFWETGFYIIYVFHISYYLPLYV